MKTPKTDPIIDRWLSQMTPEQFAQAKALPVRRDMTTLLTYLRDNRVTATQSAGLLPLKAVRAITAQFVKPPVLEYTVGSHTRKLRSEEDIWPLYFLHILAEGGGFISGGPAQRMHLTTRGEKFLAAIPAVQVWSMLSIWWRRVNWLVAFPVEGMGNEMPPSFQSATMQALLALPVGPPVDFDAFANQLMKSTNYFWSNPSLEYAEILMQSGIRRIVIDILEDFECVVELMHREKPFGSTTTRRLDTFCVTPFGQGLLQAVGDSWRE